MTLDVKRTKMLKSMDLASQIGHWPQEMGDMQWARLSKPQWKESMIQKLLE